MQHSRRSLLLLPLALGWSATACLSPTLPLPPPARPDVSPPDSRGIALVRGRVPGGTTALVENLANGRLVGWATGPTGVYSLEVPAESNDRLSVYYYEGLERSQSTIVLVPYPADDGDPSLGGAGGESSR